MKVIFGLFLSFAVAPGSVSSFTLAHTSSQGVPAQRTSSLNMVSTTLDLENMISPDDEVSMSGGMTVGALCKDVASPHIDNVFSHPFC
jgi:uncharacterized cupredoxin-like copper-binding protein